MATVVGYDTEHDCDERMAGQILYDLCQAYPGHGWFITIKGGVVQIKDLDISEKWCMALHYSQIKADAKDRKRQVIRSAGEWLERANLYRGIKKEKAMSLEGIPDKDMVRARL